MLKRLLAVLASLVSVFALTRGHAQDATGGDETLLYKDGVFYRVHTFTDHENPGSFTVGGSDLSNVDYLIVAGGGGGGNGGGGGGGMLAGTFGETLGAGQVYTVTVGDGGDGNVGHDDGSIKSDDQRRDGENSSITGGSLSVYEAIGGGAGGFEQFTPGNSGGSGGGASYDADSTTVSAASGVSGQGSAGGVAWASSFGGAAGGGGAGEAGSNSVERVGNFSKGGKGGDGLSSDITGSDVTYAGGGAGGSVIPDANTYDIPSGGAGGGGSGPSTDAGAGGQGTDGLGGGGGGGEAEVRDTPELYTSGGSGIVILRYDITSAVLGNSTLVVEGDSLDDDGNLNADETSTATIKVQLKDANGVDLTISDATVVIETDYGSVSTTENEGNGLYTATLRAPSTPGDANISAKLDGVTIGATETVTFEDYNSPVFNSVNPNYDYTDGANHFYRYENVSGLLSTFTATDDFGPITYSMKQFKGGFETWHEVSNEDDYDFSIDADSGGLSFKNLQNYEDPSDNLNAVDDQFYRVEVTATDGGGNSVSEQVFVYIFDTEVPNAPTELNIAAGSGSLDLTWKAPDFDGTSDFRTLANNGSAITGYQVSIDPGDFVDVDEGDSSYVYDGDTGIFSYSLDQLENGTEYTIGLRAKNDDYADHVSGTYGAPNAYEDANIVTASGTPVSTPAAPAIDTVVASDKTLTINFTAGSLEGGTFVKYEAATNSAFTENLVEETTEGKASIAIPNLTNGTPYTVYLRAVSDVGNGAYAESAGHKPAATPAAPTIDSVVASDKTLTINFTAGSLEGGTFVKYQAATNAAFTENLVEETTEGAGSIAIPNLTNGTPYTVYLRAVSDIGDGTYAESPGGHTPISTPVAPTIVSVVASDETLTINFTAGSLEGGTFVKYQAATNAAFTENLVEETTEGTASIAIPNLTNGTPYTVYLRAVSDVGNGAYAESAGHKPAATPAAPTIDSVVASDKTLTINFTAGSLEGGAFVKYQAATNAAFTENLVEETTEGAGSIAIPNLTNGTPYTVYLRAVSDIGDGTYAESPGGHTPISTPVAPTIVSVVASDETLTINFTAGSLEGGTFVKYQAATNSAFTENLVEETTEGKASIAIPNLTNGTPYTVYLRAVSDVGNGAYAESAGRKPAATPSAPTIDSVVASDKTLTINFTAGSLEGGTFVKYQAATNAAFTENLVEETTEGAGSIAIPNLTNGTPYTVYLRAVSDIGDGTYAESPGGHTPISTPVAPTIVSVVASDETLTINFTAGSLEGGTFVKYQAATNAAFTENLVEETTEGTASIAIPNLTNGTPYTVYLRAVSDVGNGAYAESAGHKPAATPAAPTIDSVVASDKTLTINFTAGSLEGGAFVKYQAATNAAFTENLVEETTEGAGSIAIPNLTNGTPYTVYLRAVSDIGDGTYAESPGGHTPISTPVAPTIVSVVASDETLTINFTAGSLEGGTFEKYQAATDTAFTQNLAETATEGATSLAITGLTNGTSYTVYLRAVSDIGNGDYAQGSGTPTYVPVLDTEKSTVQASATNVDAGGNFTVTVTLVDTKEAAMTGQNVTVTGTIDGSVVIEPATATEGTDGTYTTGSLSTTFAGQLTLSAKVDDLGLNNFATVTVAAGPVDAANSSLESSVGKLEADGTATATITVQGKDTHGNKVGSGGATVVMETTLGTLSDVTDTGKGTYTATLTAGTETGTAEVSATLDGTAVSNILEIAFVEPVQGVDTGGSLASQGASVNVGAAFGAIVNAGANGGLSGGGGSAAPGGSSGGSSSGGSSSGSSSGSSDGTEAGGDDGIAYNRGDYGRLYVFSARETDENVTLVDWFTWGVSDASVDAELTGDGTYGYALVGKEMFKSRRAVVGLLYGAETSRWNYEGESDVDRVGVSLGFYAGRRFGDLTLNGSVIVTESNSEFLSTSGAEGKGDSNRIMVTSSLRGQQRLLENGATVTPLFNLLLAEEEMEAFTYDDGTASEAGTSSIGRISGGLEYLTAPNARDTRYLVRGELGQVFGTDTVTLSDGTEYTPNEEVSGSLTFGWLPAPNDDTQARIELTFGEIGNDDNEEVRLEGTWDRNF